MCEYVKFLHKQKHTNKCFFHNFYQLLYVLLIIIYVSNADVSYENATEVNLKRNTCLIKR